MYRSQRKQHVFASVLVASAFIGSVTNLRAAPIEWSVAAGGNGHFYERVLKDPAEQLLSWHEANAFAAARSWQATSGHLVTLNSLAEHDFIYQNVYQLPAPITDAVWIGGFQDRSAPDYSEPAGGWRWINNEPWVPFWTNSEPNNSPAGEDYVTMGTSGLNDLRDTHISGLDEVGGYLIEYPVPEPASLALSLLGAAFVIEVLVWQNVRRRQPAPN